LNQRGAWGEETDLMGVECATPTLPVDVVRKVVRAKSLKISASRLPCVDLLRGIVMALMALDHTRSFFTAEIVPEDLLHTTGPLFFTRFVTHFCAPVSFLLAGTGGYLSLARGKSVAQVSRFFWTRGLWLVLLDLTVVGYSWTYVFPLWFSEVLWPLGWSMVAMALLIRLPLPLLAIFGAGMIATHNLFDAVNPAAFGKFSWLWIALHGHGPIWIVPGKVVFFVWWSVIPWVGVMALGYVLGALLQKANWRKIAVSVGLTLTISFVILRAFHLYGNGDPALQPWCADQAGPWRVQSTLTLTIVSFFDTLKYPASMQFLLMTLGPALMALAWLDKMKIERGLSPILLVFGRVPLFFYVLHLYLIHTMAVWVALAFHQPAAWLLYGGFLLHPTPNTYGHGLPFIYAMWIVCLLMLYPACKWFMNFKRQHQDWWWLSYF
jgi:uncharacterized membrane protein